jgi:hypothetical protein
MTRLAALCPRAEGNVYTPEVLPAFQEVPRSSGRGSVHADQRDSVDHFDRSIPSSVARPIPVEPAA